MEKRYHQRKNTGQQLFCLEMLKQGGGNFRLMVQEIDIGSGGIGFLSFKPFRKWDIVKVEYPINSERMILPIYAKVIWCKTNKDIARVGLQFLV